MRTRAVPIRRLVSRLGEPIMSPTFRWRHTSMAWVLLIAAGALLHLLDGKV
jgi:hypothetical protein